MNHLIRLVLSIGFLLNLSAIRPVQSQSKYSENLSNRLQRALNKGDNSVLNFLSSNKDKSILKTHYRNFQKNFPDAKWVIRPSRRLKDGRSELEIVVTGKKKTIDHHYSLEAMHKVAFKPIGMNIFDQKVISGYSILRSTRRQLPIRFQIPDKVLTESRYDIDLILEEPLGEAILAGGLIALTPKQINSYTIPEIQLDPMGGGGLFKSVQAPINPGSQTWAAILAHPDGLVTITKTVKVVAYENELDQEDNSIKTINVKY